MIWVPSGPLPPPRKSVGGATPACRGGGGGTQIIRLYRNSGILRYVLHYYPFQPKGTVNGLSVGQKLLSWKTSCVR
jgi:hypothetical protein